MGCMVLASGVLCIPKYGFMAGMAPTAFLSLGFQPPPPYRRSVNADYWLPLCGAGLRAFSKCLHVVSDVLLVTTGAYASQCAFARRTLLPPSHVIVGVLWLLLWDVTSALVGEYYFTVVPF